MYEAGFVEMANHLVTRGLVVVIDMAVGISVPPRIWMNCGSMCEESPIKLILSEAGSVRAS